MKDIIFEILGRSEMCLNLNKIDYELAIHMQYALLGFNVDDVPKTLPRIHNIKHYIPKLSYTIVEFL